MIGGIIVVIILIILGVVGFVYFQNKQYDKISFKETLELTGLPIITFHHKDKQNNDIKLNFLVDTGADRSIIDSKVLEQCKHTKSDKQNPLCGIDGIERYVENVCITLIYNNKLYTDMFQSSDMSNIFDKMKEDNGVTLHGILGNAFFIKYKYVVDFNKYVTYSKMKK